MNKHVLDILRQDAPDTRNSVITSDGITIEEGDRNNGYRYRITMDNGDDHPIVGEGWYLTEAIAALVFYAIKEVMNKPIDRRLLTMTQAAKELNVSRMTIRRMCNDGRLPVVETRAGRRWIPNTALTNLVMGKKRKKG
jgi:excisionase family DNA binding protein